MSKHTPEPWKITQESIDPAWHILTTDNGLRIIANVHIEPDNAQDVVNANLLLASPDLLAACEAALSPCERCGLVVIADQLRAAIAKAKGGAE